MRCFKKQNEGVKEKTGHYHVFNERDGLYHKFSSIALLLNKSHTAIRAWYGEGYTSVEAMEIRATESNQRRKETRLKNGTSNTPIANRYIKSEKTNHTYTYNEIAKKLRKSYTCIRIWHVEKGIQTIEGMIRKNNGEDCPADYRPDYTKGIEDLKFDTNNCHTEKGKIICKHYKSCQDSRVFHNQHHNRYKEDMSCFDGIRNTIQFRNSSGQKTVVLSSAIRIS